MEFLRCYVYMTKHETNQKAFQKKRNFSKRKGKIPFLVLVQDWFSPLWLSQIALNHQEQHGITPSFVLLNMLKALPYLCGDQKLKLWETFVHHIGSMYKYSQQTNKIKSWHINNHPKRQNHMWNYIFAAE